MSKKGIRSYRTPKHYVPAHICCGNGYTDEPHRCIDGCAKECAHPKPDKDWKGWPDVGFTLPVTTNNTAKS